MGAHHITLAGAVGRMGRLIFGGSAGRSGDGGVICFID
jgi:hypothetical protein